jgi:hypothetical protein
MKRTRNGQRGRSAVLSVGAHASVAVVLLMSGGTGDAPEPGRKPIIQAELVTLRAPQIPAAPATEQNPARTAEPEPAARPAKAPDSEVAANLPEPPTEPQREPPAAPVPPEETAPPALLELEPGVASSEQVAATEGSLPNEPRPENTAPTATDGIEPAPTPPAGHPLEAPQQQMLSKRLASWTGRFTPGEPTPTMAWRDNGQEFTATFRPVPAASAMHMEQLAVEVTTERDGVRLLTEMRLTRMAFSSFAQFVDRWDPEVQIHDDEIDGRFHSNSEIRVSRERGVAPVFRGKVTLAARDIVTDSVGWLNRRTLFPAGIEMGVRRIALPPQAVTLAAHAAADEQIQRFEHDTSITFHADGTYAWRPTEGSAEQYRPLSADPHYLIGADGVVLHVRGTVNGTVLVYTPERIVIEDDVRYADDPRQPGATDYLGLVAERTVEIAAPEVTGPGDLEVQASIYARRQFAVRSYRARPSGTLRIYGSVAAGSVTATEPRFATQIEFDERLTSMRAPGFPQSDRYELESWSGEWRIAQ